MKDRDKLKFIVDNTVVSENADSETKEKILKYTKELSRTLKIAEIYFWEEVITSVIAFVAAMFILGVL